MIRKYFNLFLFFIILFSVCIQGQEISKNKYGLPVVNDVSLYKHQLEKDSSNKLVDLSLFIPGIKLDIRYATSNNFLGEAVYAEPKAFLRKPAAEALKKVQAELKKMGFGIWVFDAYRPYEATEKFYFKVKDTNYVASVYSGSRHNRGCAVDLTIYSLKTGKPLQMPTAFDSFSTKAGSDYLDLPGNVIMNRDLLIGVMAKYGFENLPTEWWHYDFKDWRNFDLMNLSFKELEALQ